MLIPMIVICGGITLGVHGYGGLGGRHNTPRDNRNAAIAILISIVTTALGFTLAFS